VLASARGLLGAAVNSELLRAVQAHCGQSSFDDDVCLVTIEATRR
jgi:hypothetical protein